MRLARSIVGEVFRNELRGLVRDRRAFLTAVVLPVLLYPLLFVGMSKLGKVSESRIEEKEVTVAHDLGALDEALAARVLAAWSDPEQRMTLVEADPDLAERLEVEGDPPPASELLGVELHAIVLSQSGLDGAPPQLHLVTNRSADLSNIAASRVREALDRLSDSIGEERLIEIVERDPGAELEAAPLDVALAQDTAGHALGRLLPVIAVLVLLSAASFAALGAFAGEREAGTLETLLVQPVPAISAAAGKFLAVAVVALVALAGNMGSFLACLASGLGGFPGTEGVSGVSMNAGRLLLGLALFAPTVILLAAAACLVSARARSFREGQHYVFPLILGAAAPASLALIDQVELDWILALVPVAGSSLALRDAMSANLAAGPAILSVLAGAGWAWLALSRVARILDAEHLLSSRDTAGEMAARRIQSRRALAWGIAAVAVIYVVGGRLQAIDLRWGLVATLWILAPLLAILSARGTARRAGESLVATLGLGRPAAAHLAGALLLAPILAAAAVELAKWQQRLLPLPSDIAIPGIEELGWPTLLLLFAISPGVFEELLFRGAILSGLKKDLRPGRVMMWQGLLFGAVHASIYKFLPTALLGMILAAIVLRARCIWPTVLLHAAYNGILVLEYVDDVRDHPLPFLGLGLLGAVLLSLPRHR